MSYELLPPIGRGSLMAGAGASALGTFDADLVFDPDDTYYLGYDSTTMTNYRPREIRFTRRIASEYAAAIGATPSENNGVILRNSSAAILGTQQYSPSIFLAGQGWETTGSSSDEVIFRLETRPVQGATVSGLLNFAASLNGAAYANLIQLTSGASLLWGVDGTGNIGAAAATRPANIYAATSVNVANGSNVLTSTAATVSGAMAVGVAPAETKGLVLRNSTAAANGSQQYSPSIFLAGQGWETTGGSSDEVIYRIETRPVQGFSVSGILNFGSSLNGATPYTTLATLSTGGDFALPVASGFLSVGAAGSELYLGGSSGGAVGVTGVALYNANVAHTMQYRSVFASGAGNISHAMDADVAAASINAGHKVASFAWLSNADARTELAYLTGNGGFSLDSAKAIGVTSAETSSLVLRNSTAAADGAQQYSPSIYLAGRGWKTDATAASQEVAFQISVRPVQGAAAPTGALWFSKSVNGAAYTDLVYLNSAGTLLWATDGGGDIGASGANRPSVIYASAYATIPTIYCGTSNNMTVGAQTVTGLAIDGVANIYSTSRTFGICGANKSQAGNKAIILAWMPNGGGDDAPNVTARIVTTGHQIAAGTYLERFAVLGQGDVILNALINGQAAGIKTLTEETTVLAAANTDTAIQIPANAIVIGVSTYVTVTIPHATGVTMDYGVAGATTRYGTGLDEAAGTAYPGTDTPMTYYAGAVSIRITPSDTPSAATGKVRVTIHYITLTPPTS